MGEPAELSEMDILEADALARAVIASVINDLPFPLTGLSDYGQYAVLIMAQTLLHYKARMTPL